MPRSLQLLAFVSLPIVVLTLPSAAPSEEKEVLGKSKAEWIKILQSDTNPELRRAAVIALGIVGPTQKDVLPELNKALIEDKSEFVRLQVVAILGTVNKPDDLREVLPTLVDILKHEKSAAVRSQSAALIGKMGKYAVPAIACLEGALKDESASVRAAAVSALAQIGPEAKSSLDKMIPLFRDAEGSVRFATAYAVVRIGADPLVVVPYLNQRIESDASADVRREAAKGIGLIGLPAAKFAVPSLVKALRHDKDEDIRRQAALALGRMGSEISAGMKEILAAIQDDKDKTVRLYLIRSMSAALGRGLRSYVKEFADCLRKEVDGNVRLAIIQELGALGADAVDALPILQEMETDVVLQVREAARIAQEQIRKPMKKGPKN